MKIKEKAVRNLTDLKMIFDKAGIFFWIEHGLLLGIHREGDMIKNDEYDIDACIWQKDLDKFNAIRSEFNRKTLLKKRGRFRERCPKYSPDGTLNSVSYKRNGTQLDVKIMVPMGNVVYHIMDGTRDPNFTKPEYAVYVLPKKLYEEFGEIEWRGIKFHHPKNIEEYLIARYGPNWKIPTRNKEGWSSWDEKLNPCLEKWPVTKF